MIRNWKRSLAIPTLALTLVIWGCESVGEQQLLGPDTSAPVLSTVNTGGQTGTFTPLPAEAGKGFTYSFMVDATGKHLEYEGYALTVTPGAVTEPTLFTVVAKLEGFIEVELTATRKAADGSTINVGEQGFASPVIITMPYSKAKGRFKADQILVAWLKDGTVTGAMEAMPTVVDTRKKQARAYLEHFSDYILAIP